MHDVPSTSPDGAVDGLFLSGSQMTFDRSGGSVNGTTRDCIVLGGGLAGLAAGVVLSNAGFPVIVYERGDAVGGLSRTVEQNGFRFDLGGHRFYTKDEAIDRFVRRLMGRELVTVRRSSKIYLRRKYFDYPLKPLNAMFGLGMTVTARIIADYAWETAKRAVRNEEAVSLKDWVVSNFGRTMFSLYFKEYSEKVWGIDCDRISAAWVEQRIRGLSLATAIKNAFFKFSGRDVATLVDSFSYPSLGIGRLADRLSEEIEKRNAVATGADVLRLNHARFRVESVCVRHRGGVMTVPGDEFVSSIPLTKLIDVLSPSPPEAVRVAASKLTYRDLVIVAVMVDRERVTDQTWIYVPEQNIPFGRIHEPTNWSRDMAPAGKSLLVMEFFSFRGDAVWTMSDEALTDLTVDHLVRLQFISRREVLGSRIVRVPNAYPLFEVGYQKHTEALLDYLGRFENLHISGRSGMFRYYNMDVALRSGMETAERIIRRSARTDALAQDDLVLADALN
jgi:protoporphyrinogen oxidase